MEAYSLGNLGYASVQCKHAPVAVKKMTLSCPYGTIGSILDYGVNDHELTNMVDLCANIANSTMTLPCKPTTFGAKLNNFRGQENANLEYNMNNFWTSPVPEHC
jgi:hypothetical protein